MRIKEASVLTGLAERTIRFYEEEGLFSPKKEYYNGRYYRNYSDDDIRDLKMLATLRQAGFTMDEIRRMQNETGVVPDILSSLNLRLEQQKASSETMAAIINGVSFSDDLSVYDLSDQISYAIKKLDISRSEVHLNFGKMDGVNEAQRTAEYERFIKKRDKTRPSPLVVLTLILGILAFVFSFLFIYDRIVEKLTVPPSVGSTEGWHYWSSCNIEEERFNLYRTKGDTTELIYTESYQDTVNFSCYVGAEHLYVFLDGRLFSLNADGSGYHKIYAKSGGVATVVGEYGDNLIFYGPSGYGHSVMCVSISGGRVKNLLNGIMSSIAVEEDILFACAESKGFYAIDLYTLKKTKLGKMDSHLDQVVYEYFEEVTP